MEVVHVVRQYKPSIGGLENAVENLCGHLARKAGIAVRIVTLDRLFTAPNRVLKTRETVDGIPVTRIGYRGSQRYPLAPGILREIASATLVHVHAIDFFFDYLAMTRSLHRKKLVASTHGGFFHSSFARKLKQVYFHTATRLSASAYDTLCASSEQDAKLFSEIAPSKVVTIENGVNVTKWRDRGSPVPARTMIFVGRWTEHKAIPALIGLVAVLAKRGLPWRLLIAGIPGDETATSLRAHARERGVEDRVAIFEGPSDEEIARLIGEASFIASASRYEGFGISAIEGLSAGLVPFLSPIPPFRKLLAELELGALIDEADLEATADRVEASHAALLDTPMSLRERCIACADRYDWEAVADKFLSVYERSLGSA